MRGSESRIVLLHWMEARAQLLRPIDAPEVLEACVCHAVASSREEWAWHLVEADAHRYVGLVMGDNVARACALVDAAVRELLPSVLDVIDGPPVAAAPPHVVGYAAALRAVAPIVDGKTARHAMFQCTAARHAMSLRATVMRRLGRDPYSDRIESAIDCASAVECAAAILEDVEPLEPPDANYSDDEDELEVCGRVARDVTSAAAVAEQVLGGDAWRIYANALIRAAWCTEHEDCRASRELGRACVADRLRALPKKMLANG